MTMKQTIRVVVPALVAAGMLLAAVNQGTQNAPPRAYGGPVMVSRTDPPKPPKPPKPKRDFIFVQNVVA